LHFIALNPNTDWGCIELRQAAQAASNGRLDADFDLWSSRRRFQFQFLLLLGFKSNQTPTQAQREPVVSIVVSAPDPCLYLPKRFDFVGACCGCV
jgi:hypothetical protein